MSAIPVTSTAASRPRGRLLQVLGVAFGFSVVVGNTIGAGIMRAPGEIAAQLGSPGLFLAAWIAGGLYALLGVASLAELGVLFPRSGGQYVFARETYGDYAGFVIGWTDWISTCASAAAVAIVMGDYLAELVAPIAGRSVATACALVGALALLQWRGIRWGDRTQQISTFVKTLAFALLIIACFVIAPHAGAAAPARPIAAPGGPLGLAAVVIAMQAIVYTYDGWNGVLYFSGEVKDPARDIPRSMFAGVAGVIAIYVLVNAAFLHVLGIEGLAGSTFAAGTAARAIFGAQGDIVIKVIMLVSLFSGLNAIILMASRVTHAMGVDRLFPAVAARVNAGGTPTFTLAATVVATIALLTTGTFETAIAIAAFFFVLQYVTSFLAVFIWRRRAPDAPRPYRAIGYPVTTAISLLGGVAFLVGAVAGDTRNSLWSLALLAASGPVYLIVRRMRRS